MKKKTEFHSKYFVHNTHQVDILASLSLFFNKMWVSMSHEQHVSKTICNLEIN